MDIDVVKGIGEKKKDALESFGISSVLDLLETYPRRWIDRTREAQERMLEILQFKLDVLWSMLDAMSMAYELDRPPYHTVTRERIWHKGISL